jgi:hypothetical protein
MLIETTDLKSECTAKYQGRNRISMDVFASWNTSRLPSKNVTSRYFLPLINNKKEI